MATVSGYTSAATDALLAGKADLAGGVVPDSQAPAISVKKDTWLINIMDHGGHGDGVTSEDSALVSALAAINPTWGGKVYFPPGQYLMTGSTAATLSTHGTIFEGAGNEASSIVIGTGFTGVAAITVSANDCKIANLAIKGASTTTTSNAYADGIYINGAQRTKVSQVSFWYLNAWAISVVAGSTTGTNPSGTMFDGLVMRTCAGGINVLGNSGSGSCSILMSNLQIVATGVTTGTNANLDAIKLEDAWDVFGENVIAWMTAGTGHALHIKGHCIYSTFKNVEFEGAAASTVLIEDGTNGSPYAVKISSGVAQLGTIGIRITGGATIVNLLDMSMVNNSNHGLSVEGTGNPILVSNPYFVANGGGASGTNYDINWAGTSIGNVVNPRFETAITAVGVAGVQKSFNVPSGQNVRCWNTMFAGTGSSTANNFTNTPASAMDSTSGAFKFLTGVTFAVGLTTQGNFLSQPTSSSTTVFSSNVAGTASFDNFRLTGDGSINAGPGTAARDTTWGRLGVALFGSSDSDIVANLVGKGFRIKEGTNARMGTATLVAGAVTVANTSVTANTRIVLAVKTPSATPANGGALFVYSVTIGTGFVVHSTNAADTSVVGYVLFEAA
jgi:hypothetical protein